MTAPISGHYALRAADIGHQKRPDVAGTCAILVEIERDTPAPLLPGGAGYLGNLGALADE